MHILDEKFKEAMPNYALQSLLAVATILIILFVLDVLAHAAIVAALGSSVFIIFAMPRWVTAQPRNVIGGHIVGLATGSLFYFSFLSARGHPLEEDVIFVLAAALSVGLAIFLMVLTDTEHPPAAGTALGIIAHGWSIRAVLFVLAFAVMLSVARYLLRRWLRDLI